MAGSIKTRGYRGYGWMKRCKPRLSLKSLQRHLRPDLVYMTENIDIPGKMAVFGDIRGITAFSAEITGSIYGARGYTAKPLASRRDINKVRLIHNQRVRAASIYGGRGYRLLSPQVASGLRFLPPVCSMSSSLSVPPGRSCASWRRFPAILGGPAMPGGGTRSFQAVRLRLQASPPLWIRTIFFGKV